MSTLSSGFRFYLPQPQSPTSYNLAQYLQKMGWRATRFKCLSHFGDQHLKFDLAAAEYLEFKHLLARLASVYCPEAMPETYSINDQNWSYVLNQIANKYIEPMAWILKPALLNNGQHIHLFQHLAQIEQHYLNTQRLGGEHVLQRYLTHPHLLKGHKYSIRLFVIATNYAGAFLYPQGYFNVAVHTYQPNEWIDLRSHLTNEHLREEEANVIQIPTQGFEFFPSIYQKMKSIIVSIMAGLKEICPTAFICKKQKALALFGFDFMMDCEGRVWLLEANHGPCFPISDEHPLQAHLYAEFWQACINNFVLPIAFRQSIEHIHYSFFEKVLNQ